jgi:hypothetical protein
MADGAGMIDRTPDRTSKNTGLGSQFPILPVPFELPE